MINPVDNLEKKFVAVNGVQLCYFETGEQFRVNGTILLIHATGFHARCWDRTIQLLSDRHVVAIDMRGHGRSDKVGPFTWDVFGVDVAEFVSILDLDNVVAAGHSFGGHSVCQALATVEDRFQRALLIDPVVLAPENYARPDTHRHVRLNDEDEHPVARRRNHFDSVQAMYDNYHGKGSFASWREDVLWDYCRFGCLVDDEGVTLACPPKVEAAIYQGSSGCDIYTLIGDIKIPITILRAELRDRTPGVMDFSGSPTWPLLASRFEQGTDVYLPHLTHFIPMQEPEVIAQYLLAAD
jgi:pimeloyl-ACP methyl ester carboxylesterase